MFVREILDQYSWGGASHLKCGWHHSMGCSPRLDKKEKKVCRTPAPTLQMQSDLHASNSCSYASHTMMDCIYKFWTKIRFFFPMDHLSYVLSEQRESKLLVNPPLNTWDIYNTCGKKISGHNLQALQVFLCNDWQTTCHVVNSNLNGLSDRWWSVNFSSVIYPPDPYNFLSITTKEWKVLQE